MMIRMTLANRFVHLLALVALLSMGPMACSDDGSSGSPQGEGAGTAPGDETSEESGAGFEEGGENALDESGEETSSATGKESGDETGDVSSPWTDDVVGGESGVETSGDETSIEIETGEEIPEGLAIFSVDPGIGPASGQETVSIEGSGFEPGAKVYFGESLAESILWLSSEQILCDTPPRPPGLVDVKIVNPEPFPDVPGESATLSNGYLFFNPVQVFDVDPEEGLLQGGLPVIVTGTGFTEGSKVLFGNKSAIQVVWVSDDTLHAVTPLGNQVGTVDVHVSNSEGVGSREDAFLYYAFPEIDLITPPNGPATGGNEVLIYGVGFMGKPLVSLGGQFVDIESTTVDGTLVVIAPPHAQGAVDVEIETEYGIATAVGGYTYFDGFSPGGETTLLGVSPGYGSVAGGDDVFLTAQGITSAQDSSVLFGEVEASILSANPLTHIVHVQTPAAAEAGLVSVTLTNSNGSSTLNGAFLYEHALSIDNVSPGVGPVSGGSQVTIFGSGFEQGIEVRVGALPAMSVTVIDDTTLEAVTPPGSGGFVPVSVSFQGVDAVLNNGFFYQSQGMDLYLVEPFSGSIAGGTLVELVGSGFPGNASVSFNGLPASHVTVHDSTLITAKTPPGNIGTVPVEISSPQGGVTLPDAYTYFNPEASLGGTWGGDVEGALNISVLSSGDSSPIPDAFVILETDPTTPYQGFTNTQGQITFSGVDIGGEQMVSVSKTGYVSNTVVEFDAENITIYLVPIPDPSSGTPPPGIAAPMVTGKLFGLNKYTIIPIGSCASKLGAPSPLCEMCASDAACGAGAICTPLTTESSTKYCLTECLLPTDCPTGFSCGQMGGNTVCMPSPGEKIAQCHGSKPHIFAAALEDPPPNGLGAPGPGGEWEVHAEGDNYRVFAYPGETAIVCYGGYKDYDTGQFVPLTLGVARHVFTAPAETTEDVDIELKHQMDREVTVILDDPPVNPPHFQGIFSWLDFGSDGVIEMKHALTTSMFGTPLTLKRQVREFTGNIYDATFSFLGGGFSQTEDNTPVSLVLARNVTSIEDDTMFTLQGSEWSSFASGIKTNINGLWGSSPTDIHAVGANGAIVHYNGGGWTLQQTPVDDIELHALHGFGADDIHAVGDSAMIVHFDGLSWEIQDVPGVFSSLKSVWGATPDDVYAVGQYTMAHYDGTSWSSMFIGLSPKDYQGIHGADGSVFLVAKAAWVYARDASGAWTPAQLSHKKDLFGVRAFAADNVFAVGAEGTVSHFNGAEWTTMETPTEKDLFAVWGSSPSDVFAVGESGTIIHYDGTSWTDQSAEDHTNPLVAVWGDGGGFAVATGSHEFILSPFLDVPVPVYPAENGVMTDYAIDFEVKEGGNPASFHMLDVTQPGMMEPIPVWFMITDGTVTHFDLPEFPNIEGTPGFPVGPPLTVTMIRTYKPGFDINNYDYTDFNNLDWRSWAYDRYVFFKE
jgi:hypothetical protein